MWKSENSSGKLPEKRKSQKSDSRVTTFAYWYGNKSLTKGHGACLRSYHCIRLSGSVASVYTSWSGHSGLQGGLLPPGGVRAQNVCYHPAGSSVLADMTV